jgi:hypothetical protein
VGSRDRSLGFVLPARGHTEIRHDANQLTLFVDNRPAGAATVDWPVGFDPEYVDILGALRCTACYPYPNMGKDLDRETLEWFKVTQTQRHRLYFFAKHLKMDLFFEKLSASLAIRRSENSHIADRVGGQQSGLELPPGGLNVLNAEIPVMTARHPVAVTFEVNAVGSRNDQVAINQDALPTQFWQSHGRLCNFSLVHISTFSQLLDWHPTEMTKTNELITAHKAVSSNEVRDSTIESVAADNYYVKVTEKTTSVWRW